MEDLGLDLSCRGSVLTKDELQDMRKKRGECLKCGQKCFKKKLLKLIPLTDPGKVLNGRCLRCNPLSENELDEEPETTTNEDSNRSLRRGRSNLSLFGSLKSSRIARSISPTSRSSCDDTHSVSSRNNHHRRRMRSLSPTRWGSRDGSARSPSGGNVPRTENSPQPARFGDSASGGEKPDAVAKPATRKVMNRSLQTTLSSLTLSSDDSAPDATPSGAAASQNRSGHLPQPNQQPLKPSTFNASGRAPKPEEEDRKNDIQERNMSKYLSQDDDGKENPIAYNSTKTPITFNKGGNKFQNNYVATDKSGTTPESETTRRKRNTTMNSTGSNSIDNDDFHYPRRAHLPVQATKNIEKRVSTRHFVKRTDLPRQEVLDDTDDKPIHEAKDEHELKGPERAQRFKSAGVEGARDKATAKETSKTTTGPNQITGTAKIVPDYSSRSFAKNKNVSPSLPINNETSKPLMDGPTSLPKSEQKWVRSPPAESKPVQDPVPPFKRISTNPRDESRNHDDAIQGEKSNYQDESNGPAWARKQLKATPGASDTLGKTKKTATETTPTTSTETAAGATKPRQYASKANLFKRPEPTGAGSDPVNKKSFHNPAIHPSNSINNKEGEKPKDQVESIGPVWARKQLKSISAQDNLGKDIKTKKSTAPTTPNTNAGAAAGATKHPDYASKSNFFKRPEHKGADSDHVKSKSINSSGIDSKEGNEHNQEELKRPVWARRLKSTANDNLGEDSKTNKTTATAAPKTDRAASMTGTAKPREYSSKPNQSQRPALKGASSFPPKGKSFHDPLVHQSNGIDTQQENIPRNQHEPKGPVWAPQQQKSTGADDNLSEDITAKKTTATIPKTGTAMAGTTKPLEYASKPSSSKRPELKSKSFHDPVIHSSNQGDKPQNQNESKRPVWARQKPKSTTANDIWDEDIKTKKTAATTTKTDAEALVGKTKPSDYAIQPSLSQRPEMKGASSSAPFKSKILHDPVVHSSSGIDANQRNKPKSQNEPKRPVWARQQQKSTSPNDIRDEDIKTEKTAATTPKANGSMTETTKVPAYASKSSLFQRPELKEAGSEPAKGKSFHDPAIHSSSSIDSNQINKPKNQDVSKQPAWIRQQQKSTSANEDTKAKETAVTASKTDAAVLTGKTKPPEYASQSKKKPEVETPKTRTAAMGGARKPKATKVFPSYGSQSPANNLSEPSKISTNNKIGELRNTIDDTNEPSRIAVKDSKTESTKSWIGNRTSMWPKSKQEGTSKSFTEPRSVDTNPRDTPKNKDESRGPAWADVHLKSSGANGLSRRDTKKNKTAPGTQIATSEQALTGTQPKTSDFVPDYASRSYVNNKSARNSLEDKGDNQGNKMSEASKSTVGGDQNGRAKFWGNNPTKTLKGSNNAGAIGVAAKNEGSFLNPVIDSLKSVDTKVRDMLKNKDGWKGPAWGGLQLKSTGANDLWGKDKKTNSSMAATTPKPAAIAGAPKPNATKINPEYTSRTFMDKNNEKSSIARDDEMGNPRHPMKVNSETSKVTGRNDKNVLARPWWEKSESIKPKWLGPQLKPTGTPDARGNSKEVRANSTVATATPKTGAMAVGPTKPETGQFSRGHSSRKLAQDLNEENETERSQSHPPMEEEFYDNEADTRPCLVVESSKPSRALLRSESPDPSLEDAPASRKPMIPLWWLEGNPHNVRSNICLDVESTISSISTIPSMTPSAIAVGTAALFDNFATSVSNSDTQSKILKLIDVTRENMNLFRDFGLEDEFERAKESLLSLTQRLHDIT